MVDFDIDIPYPSDFNISFQDAFFSRLFMVPRATY